MASKLLNIINVPSDVGSIYAGKSKAPQAFRSAGLYKKLEDAGFQLNQFEAFQAVAGWASSTREPNGARNETRTVKACRSVQKTVLAALENHKSPIFQLILAGECLYCPAILSAYWKHSAKAKKTVGIIYVDADADLYIPKQGSGNIAGMTMTHLTLREGGLESMNQFSRPDKSAVVDNNNIVLFGLNIDAPVNIRAHLGYLFDNNYRVITSKAIQKAPIEQAQAALKYLEERVDYIVVHLDVDVIDPGEFPLCNVPNWTGLEFDQAMAALKTLLRSEKTVALSVAEVNPDHDPELKMMQQLSHEIVEGLKHRTEAKETVTEKEAEKPSGTSKKL